MSFEKCRLKSVLFVGFFSFARRLQLWTKIVETTLKNPFPPLSMLKTTKSESTPTLIRGERGKTGCFCCELEGCLIIFVHDCRFDRSLASFESSGLDCFNCYNWYVHMFVVLVQAFARLVRPLFAIF